MEMPPIRYARSGEVNVAYQVTGEGNPIDLVSAPGTMSHLAAAWQTPRGLEQIERLSRFSRLIRFDKRGTGMSDRVTDAATIEERADDIRAVMDAVGSREAVILGASEGGAMACVFAAQHPERTRSLIVWGCQARVIQAPDYPWGVTREVHERQLRDLEREWPSREYVRTWGAGLGDAPEEVVQATLERMQLAATPAAVVALERMNGSLDIRDVLPTIRVPTLVMAREGDPFIEPASVNDLAARIPGARVQLFPGKTHYMSAPWAGIDGEPVYSAIEEFVTGSRPAAHSDRFLTTLLFLDLVSSTDRLAEIGDSAWRLLLDSHYRALRRELERFGGHEVDTAGDGLLATFDGPARAIRCVQAILAADQELALRARSGVHVGEVERADGSLRGINVVVAARIASLAGAGEILTSSTVRDLSAGSGITFADRGTHLLKGVPDPRQILAVVD